MRPHRAPIFSELYPRLDFFEHAQQEFRALLTATASPRARAVVTPRSMRREAIPPCSSPHGPVRIVPEATGRIRRILLTVPKFLDKHDKPLMFRYARYPRHFSRLLATFGADVEWVIVTGDREWPHVKRWLRAAKIPRSRVVHVRSPQFNYSIWAQDPFLVLTDGTRAFLCEGVLFNREQDMTIADDVDTQVESIVATQSYLFFQGGNILGGEATTLIGADYVYRNTTRFGLERLEDVLDCYRALTGTDVLMLGGPDSGDDGWHRDGVLTGHGFQPIFHIDMFVTPTGVMNDAQKEIVFFARPRAAYAAVKKWSEVPYLNDSRIDAFFDETASQLATRYDVRELPLLSTRGDLGRHEEFVRYYFLTWSNAHVEISAQGRRVVLPSFVEDAKSFDVDRDVRLALQEVVEFAWRDLGFEVDIIDGMEDLAWGDGSLHCISKVLARA